MSECQHCGQELPGEARSAQQQINDALVAEAQRRLAETPQEPFKGEWWNYVDLIAKHPPSGGAYTELRRDLDLREECKRLAKRIGELEKQK